MRRRREAAVVVEEQVVVSGELTCESAVSGRWLWAAVVVV